MKITRRIGINKRESRIFKGKIVWHKLCDTEPAPKLIRYLFMMPVKIQCSCGQRYVFDIEPVCGRMTSAVACPVCGADGTTAANEVIAFTLATELFRQDSGKETVMVFAVIGCMIAGIAGVIKAFNMTNGFDVLLCLLGAIGAFGMALCTYFWKR